MKLTAGDKINGFTLTRVRAVDELNSVLFEMVHDKTGAELCYMDNGEENKLFSVAFKTLPQDSTGVFHILEHSVLCGSEKYPVKEPFVDLMKGSMNTFLNAMTYPDKTVYPVSSCNEKDFLNLCSVYLDAVFAPALLHNPNIFYQEGHHIELCDDGAYYKGVVFNEMKGAMSGVDERIEQGMDKLLFPDNCYRFNSGGSPEEITELSYEQFVKTYKKFYHPSNARFYLDGSVPLEKTLSMISQYLDRFEKSEDVPTLSLQAPKGGSAKEYYEISPEENAECRSILAMGKIIGTWADKELMLASQVLCDYLTDSNESPLKRAILSSGLAEDAELDVMDAIAQPYIMLVVRGIKQEDSERVKNIVLDSIRQIIKDGLDKDALAASINRLAFSVKQPREPQGLYRAAAALKSWLYGGDPIDYLVFDSAVERLREMAENGEFEKILSKWASADGMAQLLMLPSDKLGEEEYEREFAGLQEKLMKLSDEQIDRLYEKNRALAEWQQTPDTAEQKATLPKLSISDVSKTPKLIDTIVKNQDGTKILFHRIPSNGIIHLSMYFSLAEFSIEELTKLSLLSELYGELPTEEYSVSQLQQNIKSYIGNLSFSVEIFGRDDDTQSCMPCLAVHASMLAENCEKAECIITQIISSTVFDETDRIKEIVLQSNERFKQDAYMSGHSLAALAVDSHYSSQGAASQAIRGYTFLTFLSGFSKNFDNRINDFTALMKRMQKSCICKENLIVSVTATEELDVSGLIDKLPSGKAAPRSAAYRSSLPQKMGVRIPVAISFAVKGCHLSHCNMKYSGSLRVLENILSLEYLWNEVRVQGGAYGAGLQAGRNGSLFCYSYRDPSPARSIEIYDRSSEFLRSLSLSDEELEKFIISAVAASEPLRTPAQLGAAADEFCFAEFKDEDRVRIRTEMLSTTAEELMSWCKTLEYMSDNGAVCVVGSDAAIASCENLTVQEL